MGQLNDLDTRLGAARVLLEDAQKDEAYQFVIQICKDYPKSDEAFFLLALSIRDPRYQQKALGQVLHLNPQHVVAQEMLQGIDSQLGLARKSKLKAQGSGLPPGGCLMVVGLILLLACLLPSFIVKPSGLQYHARALYPHWSPDGQRLAITITRSGYSEFSDVWVINADGSHPINLTKDWDFAAEFANWSPDGQRIVFAAAEKLRAAPDIWVMKADGSHPVNLTPHTLSRDISPDWSPDGSHISFTSDRTGTFDIWVMAADGSNPRNMSPADSELAMASSWVGNNRLLYVGANFDHPANFFDIRAINLDGSGYTVVMPERVHGQVDVELSSQGEILFTTYDHTNHEIFVTDANGQNERNLSLAGGSNEMYTDWSPDGERITFVSDIEGTEYVYTMSSEGGEWTKLPLPEGIDFPLQRNLSLVLALAVLVFWVIGGMLWYINLPKVQFAESNTLEFE